MNKGIKYEIVHMPGNTKYPSAKSNTILKKAQSTELHSLDGDKKSSFKSTLKWIIGAINPINHVPVISTIKNIVNAKKNLGVQPDIAQTAIGGLIYGGPVGLLGGIGGWLARNVFFNKEINNEEKILAEKESNIKNTSITKGYLIEKNNSLSEINYKIDNNNSNTLLPKEIQNKMNFIIKPDIYPSIILEKSILERNKDVLSREEEKIESNKHSYLQYINKNSNKDNISIQLKNKYQINQSNFSSKKPSINSLA